jgi:hypothetical protein
MTGKAVGVTDFPVFLLASPLAQSKGGRGFRRLSFCGLQKVAAEWDLICLTHNLL